MSYLLQSKYSLADASYVRRANARAVIRGKYPSCDSELIKARIMGSSALTSLQKRAEKSRENLFSDITNYLALLLLAVLNLSGN